MGNSGSLFEELQPSVPKTEGIKYAGSKLKLLPHILSLFDGLNVSSVFDCFTGSTRVAQALAQLKYTVTAGDISEWSNTIGICYLKNRRSRTEFAELIAHLNAVPGYDGWFTENYGGSELAGAAVHIDGRKKPWQIKNTRRLDGIRDEIDKLSLDEHTKCVALTSLIYALDKVDNTLGHFVSYLKDWSPRSFNDLRLEVPSLFINEQDHTVLKGDIFDIARDVNCDFAYLDPPYGSNNEKMPPSRVRYASYYHVWTTVIKNDKPELFGAASRRLDTRDGVAASVFEEFRQDEDGRFISVKAIDRLISSISARYVALSYSSGGRATALELNDILAKHGRLIKVLELDYRKNVMASMRWTNEWLREVDKPNREFLFLIEK